MDSAQILQTVISAGISLIGVAVVVLFAGRRWTTDIEVKLAKGDARFLELDNDLKDRATKADVAGLQSEIASGFAAIRRELSGYEGRGGLLDDIARLKEEVRTVDARITDSRHLQEQRTTALTGNLELRFEGEIRQIIDRLRIVEETCRFCSYGRRTSDPRTPSGPLPPAVGGGHE